MLSWIQGVFHRHSSRYPALAHTRLSIARPDVFELAAMAIDAIRICTGRETRESAMRRPVRTIALLIVGLTLLTGNSANAGEREKYVYPETQELVDLVEAAAEIVHQDGEQVFPIFRKEGSRWFHDNLYIFIWDLEGNRYVYPPDLEHERANVIGLKDIDGRPIGRMIIGAAAQNDGRGWVHYRWNRPHESDPLWKSTYIVKVTAPSGKTYLVGSGIYLARVEKAFIIEMVESAAVLLELKGTAAFARLRDPKGRFFFHDTCVFVTSAAGTELVNPAFPALEGRNLWDTRDSNGAYIVREIVRLALERGSGWVSYLWPKPDVPNLPRRKISYVKKVTVDNQIMIVGAGMYE
jgi:hypothetical protein